MIAIINSLWNAVPSCDKTIFLKKIHKHLKLWEYYTRVHNDYSEDKKVLIVVNSDRFPFPSYITFNFLYPKNEEIFFPSSPSFLLMARNYYKLADEVPFKTFQIWLAVPWIKSKEKGESIPKLIDFRPTQCMPWKWHTAK